MSESQDKPVRQPQIKGSIVTGVVIEDDSAEAETAKEKTAEG